MRARVGETEAMDVSDGSTTGQEDVEMDDSTGDVNDSSSDVDDWSSLSDGF